MKTDFETLKALAAYTLNYLTEHKIVQYNVDVRLDIIEAMATELGVGLSTDDDIRDQAIEEVEEKMGLVQGDITETEMYNHARKEIIKAFNGEMVGGLYLVESLNQLANRMRAFLLENDLIDDVFASDDEIVDFLIKVVGRFSPQRA
ncbi:MAG: hypothetical protein OXB88_06810 [Bacteriovoracales bacterium]|nr:hypothetical protein [Bacteriovoracales bacterium]